MRSKKISKHGAIIVDKATQSLLQFNYEIEQTEMLIFFIIVGGKYISENKEGARQTLIEIYEEPGNDLNEN